MTNVVEIIKNQNAKIYMGPFSDKNGNPDFHGIGPIFKGLFIMYILFIILSKNITYAAYILIIGAIGFALNSIRFYYVNPLIKNGPDAYFLDMNVIEYAVESGILLFVALYLLYCTSVKKV